MSPLFNIAVGRPFLLHSGGESRFMIDCDALTDDDLYALAVVALPLVQPFGYVEGVATGGLRLASALRAHVSAGPLLIVDDVFTTGESMSQQRAGRQDVNGLVIFARSAPPPWIKCMFRCYLGGES